MKETLSWASCVLALTWMAGAGQAGPAEDAFPVVLNEFLAANSTGLADPQSQQDDWIELHNRAALAVDLAGYYLTDDLSVPQQWRFPVGRPQETSIAPGGYLLIWADNDPEDRPGLHANFKLSSGGERLGLFAPDGQTLLDCVTFDEQHADLAFGRHPAAGQTWRYLTEPTPGAENAPAYPGLVSPVAVSHKRGFYDEPISVVMATDTEGATLWYTTDGSEPYAEREGRRGTFVRNGSIYRQALQIDTTTCLRIKAIKPKWRPSETVTHTYLFLEDVIRQRRHPEGFPTTWGGQSANYRMSHRVVNDPRFSGKIKDALLTHPTISLVFEIADLFDPGRGIYVNSQREGVAWERPVSMEFIDPAGGPEIQVNAGIRIQGGASRNTNRPKHNLRLLFKGQYGPSRLEFPIFQDWPVQRFDTLILRGGNGDSWIHPSATQRREAQYVRDQFARASQNDMHRLTTGQRMAHLYFNGLYWGLYHILEKPNASFFAEHLGGDKEEYDALQHKNGTVDGNREAWNTLMTISNGGLNSPRAVDQLARLVDIPALIDYMILNFFIGNVDWDHNNWFGGRRRGSDEGFRFLTWDCERTILSVSANVTDKNNANQPTRIHQRLTANENYRMQFADHAQRLLVKGPLSADRAAARWLRLADDVRLALVAEAARWGDAHRPAQPYLPDQEWQAELDRRLQTYFPQRTDIVLEQLISRNLYPRVAAPDSVIAIDPGTHRAQLTMTAAGGTIWYTLDGSDPRLTAERTRGLSQQYQRPIPLDHSVHLKARALSGRTWSALHEARYSLGPLSEQLRISEIMYHPPDPNLEFLELVNLGPEPLNLNGVHFTEGIDYVFGDRVLSPAARLVLVANPNRFLSHYGDMAETVGPYQGRLSDAGERLSLADINGAPLVSLSYRDGWFDVTDGGGYSLTLIDPEGIDAAQASDSALWRPSAFIWGSPGADDSDVALMPGAVVINEVLAHPRGGQDDWIELKNTTTAAIDVSGWFLSDRDDDLTRYTLSDNLIIPAQGYLLLSARQWDDAFGLSRFGDQVYLSAASNGQLLGYRVEVQFTASGEGMSFGRYQDTGMPEADFVVLAEPTPGAANSLPWASPVVISEIMYHPDWPDAGPYVPGRYEYIELHNRSDQPVSLSHADSPLGWTFTDGIDFAFPAAPQSAVIGPGDTLLVIRDPNAFFIRYPDVDPQIVYGPYNGFLANGGELIELGQPVRHQQTGRLDFEIIDRVAYGDGSSNQGQDTWPAEADGLGSSLHRVRSIPYGNSADSWIAGEPTPGY